MNRGIVLFLLVFSFFLGSCSKTHKIDLKSELLKDLLSKEDLVDDLEDWVFEVKRRSEFGLLASDVLRSKGLKVVELDVPYDHENVFQVQGSDLLVIGEVASTLPKSTLNFLSSGDVFQEIKVILHKDFARIHCDSRYTIDCFYVSQLIKLGDVSD